MKAIYTILCISLTMLLSGACDSYEDENQGGFSEVEQASQTARLAEKPWQAEQVSYNGTNVTDVDFDSFTITFTQEGTWSTEDGDPAFAASGTWAFVGESTTNITMNNVPVTLAFSFDGLQLQLQFTLNNASIGSRQSGVDGQYLFNLIQVD